MIILIVFLGACAGACLGLLVGALCNAAGHHNAQCEDIGLQNQLLACGNEVDLLQADIDRLVDALIRQYASMSERLDEQIEAKIRAIWKAEDLEKELAQARRWARAWKRAAKEYRGCADHFEGQAEELSRKALLGGTMGFRLEDDPITHRSLLDNVGIQLNVATLDAWPEYVEARDAWFGLNWFSRLWMRWFHSAQYRELKTCYEAWLAEVQMEFTNATIEAGKDRIR